MKRRSIPINSSHLETLCLNAFGSSGFLQVNKILIQKLGFLDAGIFANYLDKHKFHKITQSNFNGWFYLTYQHQQDELNVSEYAVTMAKKRFIQLKILTSKRMGSPAKEWYHINFKQVIKFLEENTEGVHGTSPCEFGGTYNNNKYKKNKDNKEESLDGTMNFKINSILKHTPITWKDDPKLIKLLKEYLTHRKQKRAAATPIMLARLGKKLGKYSKTEVIQSIEKTLNAGWLGIFPESLTSGQQKFSNVSTTYQDKDPKWKKKIQQKTTTIKRPTS